MSSKFYITTSIPYVNADPHIGFGMELVMTDVLARYARQQGKEVIFSTGTDEHGSKIAEKAEEMGKDPQEFTDEISQHFKALTKLLNASNDRFIRTTHPEHEKRAQQVWKNLGEYIYKNKYQGWYCVGCEEFKTEQTVKNDSGICPVHKRDYQKVEEENYFFRLSKFSSQIKEVIESGSFRILPESRKNEILSVINEGLEDISVSRPKDKISWGIAVPGDKNQVMYVWFEALLNYITVLGYPDHKDFNNYWPADVQVIGKDILRFHAAIWPGILLGLGLPLPKKLFVHGFLTVDGQKMSKSLGNVIAPSEIVEKYGSDVFRYFFTRHVPSYEDGDFSFERLDAAYNNELADQLGNAVNRTAAMINRYQKGVYGEIPESEHDIARYSEAMDNCRFDRAMEEVWEQVKGINQYIEEAKPWEIAKNREDDHLREVLAYMVSCLLEIADLLTPFMPETAEKIKNIFSNGTVKPLDGTLFPKDDSPKRA